MLPTKNSSPLTGSSVRLLLSSATIHCRWVHDIARKPVKTLLRTLLCFGLLAFAVQARAQPWPSRPIKLIVPTGPGAATDVMARLLSDAVSRSLGQTMVVENMAGASGLLAHQSVARAAPDGYTLLFTNTSGMAINLVSVQQRS